MISNSALALRTAEAKDAFENTYRVDISTTPLTFTEKEHKS